MHWGLGKLGVAIVFVAATAGVMYALFFRGGSESDASQGAIREYYESSIGGSVPSDVANRLYVQTCDQTAPLDENEDRAIVRCDVRVGKRSYRPCFGFDVDDRVVSGPYQIKRDDCDRLVYDATAHEFVLAGSR